ncbi:MAG: trypsin-like peptidase domain-containing protein [Bdellovibrionia bacterium]
MKKLLIVTLVTALALSAFLSDNSGTAQVPQRTPPPMKFGEPLPANAFIELAKIINPAVVNISTSVLPRRNRMRDPMLEMLERFYGMPLNQQEESSRPRQFGLGTGFIIREDGLIVTNAHVIDGADIVNVQLTENTDKLYEATVIGSDKRTDIALIKIQPDRKLPVAALGSSKDLQVGEWVAAFGNPFGHGHTMTKGIVSSIGREIGEINKFPLIQTDASINPGNSGGPLVNLKGYVIGVNSAIDARAQGIGFAIPIDDVKSIIPQLESRGSVRRGFIGAGLADLDPRAAEYFGLQEESGAVVTVLEKNGPAAKAGIRVYDVIIEFNGKKIKNSNSLIDAVADAPIGQSVKAVVLRGDQRLNVNIKVAERKEERQANNRPQPGSRNEKSIAAALGMGFKMTAPTKDLIEEWGYPEDLKNPIVTEVERNSLASRVGLRVGDVILDVNKKNTETPESVNKNLKKGTNTLRVARGGRLVILTFDLK